MFDVFRNRLEISGVLTTITALRIAAGRSLEPGATDLPVVKDILGAPYIPGASFKGALRSRLESFLRGILNTDDTERNRKLVANPAINDEWSLTSAEIKGLKGKNLRVDQLSKLEDTIALDAKEKSALSGKDGLDDDSLTKLILRETDWISLLFGSPWIASKFQVRDLPVLSETWFDQYQERNGVAIDRDTETAADGKLYDFQVVPAGTEFEFKAVIENAEAWELGLLMIGLHQFETEQIPLGGGRSRGLGVVSLNIDKMLWFDSEEDPQKLLTYLQKLVANHEDAYENALGKKDTWVKALIEKLQSKVREVNHA